MKPIPLLIQQSSLCDVSATAHVVHRVTNLSDRLGLALEPIAPDNVERRQQVLEEHGGSDGLLFLILTGGSEAATLREVRQGGVTAVGLVAHPEFNSLPAALEIAAFFQNHSRDRDDVRVRLVQLSHAALRGTHQKASTDGHTPSSTAAGVDELVGLVRALQARRDLDGTRLGVIGDPSPWLLTSQALDKKQIQRDWGVDLVDVNMEALQTELGRTSAQEVQFIADEMIQNAERPPTVAELESCDCTACYGCGAAASGCCCCGAHGVVPQHVTEAARVYKALEAVVARNHVSAFTIRCFDLLERPVVAGCLAVSLMNDKGIVAGCEGDVHATLTMLLARAITNNQASFMANPVEIDATKGRVLLCHCTIARTLCDSYSLDTHFESSLSVSIAGKLRVPNGGPVTIARVDASRNLVFAVEGTVDTTYTRQSNQCRTQVMVNVAPADARAMLDHPLGNHHILMIGSCAAAFRAYAQLFVVRPARS